MTSAGPVSPLCRTVHALRLALRDSPDLVCFLGEPLEEETATAARAEGVPPDFLDFCRVLNGASCSTPLQLFDLEEAESHQFYCQPVTDCPLPLSPEKLYCIGLVNDTPVYLERTSGSVLATPERQGEWTEAEHLEQLADGLEAFFVEQVAASEYVRLTRIDDEMLEFDDWPELLRRAGLAD